MKPPYELTYPILGLLTAISEQLGEVKARHLNRRSPELRKKNRVQTLRASLGIEGNRLNEEQITAIIDQKRVVGPQKDILEVLNAIRLYDRMKDFNPNSVKDFLAAHAILMEGLVERPGSFRRQAVGIFKGNQVAHLAPPADRLDTILQDLFSYIEKGEDPVLIKSCVVHYEIEFIHPFMDGNGRMGRFWQTLLLLQEYPVFEYLPFETIIKQRQDAYYEVLKTCDRAGSSTKFIVFMLEAIREALDQLLDSQNNQLAKEDRVAYYISMQTKSTFTRKDYRKVFRSLSTATASRDLKRAVDQGLLVRKGDKRTTEYSILKSE
ncbi:MAG: Fic family protein [Bacteroidota bacterium]